MMNTDSSSREHALTHDTFVSCHALLATRIGRPRKCCHWYLLLDSPRLLGSFVFLGGTRRCGVSLPGAVQFVATD